MTLSLFLLCLQAHLLLSRLFLFNSILLLSRWARHRIDSIYIYPLRILSVKVSIHHAVPYLLVIWYEVSTTNTNTFPA